MAGSVIREALGADWSQLAPLVRRHFGMGPMEDPGAPLLTLHGTMEEVSHHGPGRLLFPLLGVFGVLVPRQGRDVPCSVTHRVEGGALVWDRRFVFPGRRPYRFLSTMIAAGPGTCIERVRFGLAIVMGVSCRDGRLVFEDRGYQWHMGRWRVPLPLRWLMGALRVEEFQQGDTLRVSLTLAHPWLGVLFVYRGRFTLPAAAAQETIPRSR